MFKGILNFLCNLGFEYLNFIKDVFIIIKDAKIMKFVNPAIKAISLKNKNNIAIIVVIIIALVGVSLIPTFVKNLNFGNICPKP